jgi:vancomycin resistance protein YoaR
MARAAKTTTKKTTATKTLPPKRITAAPLPKISKDDLRAQVTKLELTVTTLRTKNREANRAAKMIAAKIGELEEHVAQLEKKLASQATAATRSAKAPAWRSIPVMPCRRASRSRIRRRWTRKPKPPSKTWNIISTVKAVRRKTLRLSARRRSGFVRRNGAASSAVHPQTAPA